MNGSWLDARGLAKKLGVSDQTVYNWAAAGMPVAGSGGSGRKKARQFDPAACEAWADRNRPGWREAAADVMVTGRGGKRDGAGRRPAADPDAVPVTGEAKAKFGDAAIQAAVLADMAAGVDVIELVRRHQMTPALAKTLRDASDAQVSVMKARKEMGELVEAAGVRDAGLAKARAADEVLLGGPGLVAAEMAAAFGLSAGQQETARKFLADWVERVRGQLMVL